MRTDARLVALYDAKAKAMRRTPIYYTEQTGVQMNLGPEAKLYLENLDKQIEEIYEEYRREYLNRIRVDERSVATMPNR